MNFQKFEEAEDRQRDSVIELIHPYKETLLFGIVQPILSIPFQHDGYRTTDYPYQLIGGEAVFYLYNLITNKSPDISSPDIDIEVAPLVDWEHKPIPLWRETSKQSDVFPFFKYKRRSVEVYPAYVAYMTFVSIELKKALESLISTKLASLNEQCSPVNPKDDVEASYENADLSYDVGNFHVSVIFNPSFMCKIQILINYHGKIEHIVELIFFKSKISHFSPMVDGVKQNGAIVNITPYVGQKGLFIATPFDLLENNIEAYVSRLSKKAKIESAFDGSDQAVETLIHMNTKIRNTIDRIVILIGLTDIVCREAVNVDLDERFREALRYLLANINPKLCEKLKQVEGIFINLFSNIQILDKCGSKKTPNITVSSKSNNLHKSKYNFRVLLLDDDDNSNPIKEAININYTNRNVIKSATKKYTKTKAPTVDNMNVRNFNAAITPFLMSQTPVKTPVTQTMNPPEIIIIKEPMALDEPMVYVPRIPQTVELHYRKTLVSVITFLKERDPDFTLVYLMPSLNYSYYKGTHIHKNIIFEDPSCHYIFKLYIQIHYLIDAPTLTSEDSDFPYNQAFNEMIILQDQLQQHRLITQEKLAYLEKICGRKFFIENYLRGNYSLIKKALIESLSETTSYLLYNMLKKNNTLSDFKYSSENDIKKTMASFIKNKMSTIMFFSYLLNIRMKMLYNLLQNKKVYMFIPYYMLGTLADYPTESNEGYQALLFQIFKNFKINLKPLPSPSFSELISLGILPKSYELNHLNQFCLEYNTSVILNYIKGKNISNVKQYIASIVFVYENTLLNTDQDIRAKTLNGRNIINNSINILPNMFEVIFSDEPEKEDKLSTIIKKTKKNARDYLYSDIILYNEENLDRLIRENPKDAAKLENKRKMLEELDHVMLYQDLIMASNFPHYRLFTPSILEDEEITYYLNKKNTKAHTPKAVEGMNRKTRKRHTRKK
jgi:hypothetical protein